MTDREKIIALAEKVMGWRACEMGYGVAVDGIPDRPWNPLESIADAWMMVEVLVAGGWNVVLKTGPYGAGVSVTCPRGPCERHGNARAHWHGVEEVCAHSAPRAICDAAIRVVGVEP